MSGVTSEMTVLAPLARLLLARRQSALANVLVSDLLLSRAILEREENTCHQ